MHKPAEVNQSAFWNLDFSVGFSTLVTTLGTVGLLGALAWLLPLLLVLIAALRAVRLNILNRDERAVALSVILGALILFGGIILYVPSPSVTLLAFICAGAAFGYLWRQGRQAMQETTRLSQILGLAAVFGVLALSLWGTWVADRRFVAQAKNNQGAVALTKGNAEEALAKAQASQAVEVTPDNLRLAVEAGIYQLGQIANGSDSSQTTQQKFLDLASTTNAHAKLLIDAYPNDYRSYNTAARIYDLLAGVKIQGAYQNAEALYQKALAYNPSAPNITLALARLEASQNKIDLTQKYLSQTLTLKPNYTDAILLVVQLNVANNDIPSAIRAPVRSARRCRSRPRR
jgi:tetratricopeptide (TPR) repeat protein